MTVISLTVSDLTENGNTKFAGIWHLLGMCVPHSGQALFYYCITSKLSSLMQTANNKHRRKYIYTENQGIGPTEPRLSPPPTPLLCHYFSFSTQIIMSSPRLTHKSCSPTRCQQLMKVNGLGTVATRDLALMASRQSQQPCLPLPSTLPALPAPLILLLDHPERALSVVGRCVGVVAGNNSLSTRPHAA